MPSIELKKAIFPRKKILAEKLEQIKGLLWGSEKLKKIEDILSGITRSDTKFTSIKNILNNPSIDGAEKLKIIQSILSSDQGKFDLIKPLIAADVELFDKIKNIFEEVKENGTFSEKIDQIKKLFSSDPAKLSKITDLFKGYEKDVTFAEELERIKGIPDDGNEENLIKKAQQLVNFANIVNAYLESDEEVVWEETTPTPLPPLVSGADSGPPPPTGKPGVPPPQPPPPPPTGKLGVPPPPPPPGKPGVKPSGSSPPKDLKKDLEAKLTKLIQFDVGKLNSSQGKGDFRGLLFPLNKARCEFEADRSVSSIPIPDLSEKRETIKEGS